MKPQTDKKRIQKRRWLSGAYEFAIEQLARVGSITATSDLGFKLQKQTSSSFIRAITYHNTPPSTAESFERQVQWLAQHFVNVDYEAFTHFQNGEWAHDKPGIMFTFDDGLAHHAEVAAPILEKYGFTGWFMLPVGFIDTPEQEQSTFAARVNIGYTEIPDRQRGAMTWEQAKYLAERHVVGCHTINHCRLADSLSDEDFRREIIEAKSLLEARLNTEVPTFCWVGGEEWSYSRGAAQAIKEAGFKVALTTMSDVFRPVDNPYCLHRTNCDPEYSEDMLKLCISGFFDARYLARRRRVLKLIS